MGCCCCTYIGCACGTYDSVGNVGTYAGGANSYDGVAAATYAGTDAGALDIVKFTS